VANLSGIDGGTPNWPGLAFAAVLVLAVGVMPAVRSLLSRRKRP
jgi:hypothetical protein